MIKKLAIGLQSNFVIKKLKTKINPIKSTLKNELTQNVKKPLESS